MNYYLYRHIRTDKNEPFYIGKSTCFKTKSFNEEFERAFNRASRNNIWKKIVKKTKYKVEIMFVSKNEDFIFQKEAEFIKLYGRIDQGTGILANLTDGGEGTQGLERTEEHCRKISGALTGKKLSQSHCDSIGRSKTGVIHSEETKQLMSEVHTERRRKTTQRVRDTRTGIVYRSIAEAEEELGYKKHFLKKRLYQGYNTNFMEKVEQ